MAYSDDIEALIPVARYSLDGNADDVANANNGIDGNESGGNFSGPAICEDVTNSYRTTGINNRIVLPDDALINSSNVANKAVCGWFSTTGIQNPPKNIYGEGNATQSFRFVLGWGNNLVFEVDSASFTLQIFGDTPLEINRPYHLTLVFEGNGSGNILRAYLDGVLQTNAEPTSRQPNTATLAARSGGEFGDPAGTVAVGGTAVILLAPIDGQYNEWAMFEGTNAILTGTEIREELFEKGALPDNTITNQAGLDALATTVRPNAPLCIRVSAAGSIALSANNVTFDPLASCHVQYTGTGTLNWTNTNGSNASIGSTPGGGTINFINPATFTIAGLIAGSEVRIYDDETEDGTNMNTELDGIESLIGTSFGYSHSGVTNDIVIQVIASGYVEISRRFTVTNANQNLTLFPTIDINA
jgi:hypothetical protein